MFHSTLATVSPVAEHLTQDAPIVDLSAIAPVSIVLGAGVVALIVEMLMPRKTNGGIVAVSFVGLALAFLSLIPQFGMLGQMVEASEATLRQVTVFGQTFNTFAAEPVRESFGGMVLRDGFGLTVQLLLIVIAAVAMLFSEDYLRARKVPFGEFYPLALWSTGGAMIMATTDNLLMLFLGLEVLSISLYCLAGLARQDKRSEESAIKYFLMGAFASAFLVFGMAYVYGATGTLALSDIRPAVFNNDLLTDSTLMLGLGFVFVGLAFKAAFVPFHQWTPDVYQGAPTNVTAFMAAASKVAAFAAFVRVAQGAIDLREAWLPALTVMAVLTMTIGNLIALTQRDVKRALGYSSIAHAGYALVAVVAHLTDPASISLQTLVYYLVAYSAMTLGAFAVVSLAAKDGSENSRYQDLHGLWKRSPFMAGSLVVFVASLIGIPPTAGFVGKLYIFRDALEADLTFLAIALAINSAIAAFYYLMILRAAFVDEEAAEEAVSSPARFGHRAAAVVCLAATLGVALFGQPIREAVGVDDPERWTQIGRPEIDTRGVAPDEVPPGARTPTGAVNAG